LFELGVDAPGGDAGLVLSGESVDADDDGVSGFYAALVVVGGVLDLLLDRDFLTDPLPAGTQQCNG
jgi:hypothetical protein